MYELNPVKSKKERKTAKPCHFYFKRKRKPL